MEMSLVLSILMMLELSKKMAILLLFSLKQEFRGIRFLIEQRIYGRLFQTGYPWQKVSR